MLNHLSPIVKLTCQIATGLAKYYKRVTINVSFKEPLLEGRLSTVGLLILTSQSAPFVH